MRRNSVFSVLVLGVFKMLEKAWHLRGGNDSKMKKSKREPISGFFRHIRPHKTRVNDLSISSVQRKLMRSSITFINSLLCSVFEAHLDGKKTKYFSFNAETTFRAKSCRLTLDLLLICLFYNFYTHKHTDTHSQLALDFSLCSNQQHSFTVPCLIATNDEKYQPI